MPQSFDRHLADYPLYIEGYDHGVADADRSHRHDYLLGILVGVVAALVALYFAPFAFRMIWH